MTTLQLHDKSRQGIPSVSLFRINERFIFWNSISRSFAVSCKVLTNVNSFLIAVFMGLAVGSTSSLADVSTITGTGYVPDNSAYDPSVVYTPDLVPLVGTYSSVALDNNLTLSTNGQFQILNMGDNPIFNLAGHAILSPLGINPITNPNGPDLSISEWTFSFLDPVDQFSLTMSAPNYDWNMAAYDADGNLLSQLTISSFSVQPPITDYYGFLSDSGGVISEIVLTLGSTNCTLDCRGYDSIFLDFLTYVLFVQGPSTENTERAISELASHSVSALVSQTAWIANSLEYDCTQFGPSDLCVNIGGRSSSVNSGDDSEQAGFVTVAYRPFEMWRIGGFVDQQFKNSTGALLDFKSELPMVGGFVGYGANDGVGLQFKASGSLRSGELTSVRSNSLENTEAGSGSADLDAWGVSGEIAYGIAVSENVLASPFAALRHVESSRAAYTETLVTGEVDYPLGFDKFGMTQTTGIIGIKMNGQFGEFVGIAASAGVEHDFELDTDGFDGASDITGLETFSINAAVNSEKTRLFAAGRLDVFVADNLSVNTGLSARELAYSNEVDISTRLGVTASW